MLYSDSLEHTGNMIVKDKRGLMFIMEFFFIDEIPQLVLSVAAEPNMASIDNDGSIRIYYNSKRRRVVASSVNDEDVDINSKDSVTAVERVGLYKESIVLDAYVYTNSKLMGGTTLDTVSILRRNHTKVHKCPLLINNIEYIHIDPYLCADLLNRNVIQVEEDNALETYNIMPRFRVLDIDEETGKTKVVTYRA